MQSITLRLFISLVALLAALTLSAQEEARPVTGWKLQDAAKVAGTPAQISVLSFRPENWYVATVPGTVLTTLVDNKVYPEPLYGENMRTIPESLNKTSYWYRTLISVPKEYKGWHTWLHFAGINYAAEVWINGQKAGQMRGAFLRGDFDISSYIKPGKQAVVAVLIAPQPHPGEPHEHTVALGIGKNGGDTAIDGPTFLSTIGWDWLAAVRDRDTGIWLPVTLSSTGPVRLKDPFVTSVLAPAFDSSDLTVSAEVENLASKAVSGTLIGTITGSGTTVTFRKQLTLEPNTTAPVTFNAASTPELHLNHPRLWWPNGYGPQNLYTLSLQFLVGEQNSSTQQTSFGIRKIEYQVADSENLTLSVNGVRIMARGGNWGLDEAMKRLSSKRLDAQFRMHAQANLNMIRNWVGQSTSPEFYELADKYGILLWDEFFQPNPSDGPDVTDIPTYLANVSDKVRRYRNHPSIAVWCARNEGYPPAELDRTLGAMMAKLDPSRLYQSNSADGRGVSSHGPYYWRSPELFYAITESFKTETGSVSIPTIESIQGMMPEKDWETINDDWAQHDMARGAQRGDEYPFTLAKRYGPIRNLADFVRKGQMANYEAFRAMYEGRNSEMFKTTTGVLTWMSHPAQPSFVWQLYHYDLEPNSSLYAVQKAAESVHVQLNESNGAIEVVNNKPDPLTHATVRVGIYRFDGGLNAEKTYPIKQLPGSRTSKVAQINVDSRISPVYFVKLDLVAGTGALLSTNFYWKNVAQEDFTALAQLPEALLDVTANSQGVGDTTVVKATIHNGSTHVALMAHLQVHRKTTGARVLPVFYSDNYISLVPGESRQVRIEMATDDLHGESPLLLLDGYNVEVNPSEGQVAVGLNLNAQPMHWPASTLVSKLP